MAIEGLNTGFAITLYAYRGQVAMHSHVNCIFKSPLLLLVTVVMAKSWYL